MQQAISLRQFSRQVLLIVFAALSINNQAIANEGDWYLRIHAGLSQQDDTSGQTQSIGSVDGRLNVDLDRGFLAGMAFGRRYGLNWATELAWEYRSNDSDNRLADNARFDEGNYASNVFFLNGFYHFSSKGNWEPHVGAGLGWVQEIDLDLENATTEMSYSGDGNIGIQLFVGANYLINTDWSINGELRYGDFGDIDLSDEEGALGTIESLEYAPLTLQLGLSYRF